MLVAYELLTTGIPTLDRFEIRGSAVFWSWVENVDPRCILAIIHNESQGDPGQFVGDNGASLGPGNIQFPTWQAATGGSDEDVWRSRNSPGHEAQGVHDVVKVWKWIKRTVADDREAFATYNGGKGGAAHPAEQEYADNALSFMGRFPA